MIYVSVVIVNWNTQDILSLCLDSLYKNTKIPFDVFIIDNNPRAHGTRACTLLQFLFKKWEPVEICERKKEFLQINTDNILEDIIQKYKNVHIIKNCKNLGFAHAVNQGILSSKGEYIFTLNPDVIVTEGYIDMLFEKIKADKAIGAISGKLLNLSNKRRLDSAGQIIYKNRFARDRGYQEIDANQYQGGYVFGTCAAATLYRREMLQDVKINDEYFDGDFFAYLEDVDLAWRAQIRGWKFYFLDNAIAYHSRAISSQIFLRKIKRKFLGWRNRFFMIIKNDSLLSVVVNMPFLVFGPVKSIRMFRKRRLIQKSRVVDHQEVAKWFLPYHPLKTPEQKCIPQ
ncbi:MAG: glycosyltransferase family 2 protein [Candidatus Brocadia sp.]|nr:glycosyltransferase family 2 protein [Candidatus Brocadia sp.]